MKSLYMISYVLGDCFSTSLTSRLQSKTREREGWKQSGVFAGLIPRKPQYTTLMHGMYTISTCEWGRRPGYKKASRL